MVCRHWRERTGQNSTQQAGLRLVAGGIHWNRFSAQVLPAGPAGKWDDVICNPGGVIKENGTFKMWYSGATYYPRFPLQWPYVLWQTGLATSTDGIHWTKYDDPATTDAPYQFSDPVLKAEPWAGTPKPRGPGTHLRDHRAAYTIRL